MTELEQHLAATLDQREVVDGGGHRPRRRHRVAALAAGDEGCEDGDSQRALGRYKAAYTRYRYAYQLAVRSN
jgi:hypothetical protein